MSLREGNASEAITSLQNMLKDDPRNIQMHVFLGNAYLAKRDMQNARKIFEKVIEMAPNNPVGYSQLGRVLLIQKKENEALDRLETASPCSPLT